MLTAPYLYYDFFGDFTFTVFLFFLYLLIVYNDWFTARMASRTFLLWRIPGLRGLVATTVDGFAELRSYYASRPPIGWLRSMFSLFLLPFSADVRKEWKLFNGLVAFGMVFVILQFAGWVQEYFTLYTPELTLWSLISNKLVLIVAGAIITLMLVIPIIRTLTYIELAGEVGKARWFVLLALVLSFGFPFLTGIENFPIENYLRLKERLKSSALFAQKFDPFIKEFTQQHYQPQQFSARVTDDGKERVEYRLSNTRLALTTSIQLTRLLRQQLVSRKIVPRSEVNGLRVLAFDVLLNGEWRPGLLVYAGHGLEETGSERTDANNNTYYEFDWHILKTAPAVPRRQFISIEDVGLLYRVLMERMKSLGEGDQLSPDFKGTSS